MSILSKFHKRKRAMKLRINKLQKQMNKILVERGEHKMLMKIFNVSHVTVRESLRGNIKTDLGKKIRKAAIERGGIEKQTSYQS